MRIRATKQKEDVSLANGIGFRHTLFCSWKSNRRLCKHCLYVLLKILGFGYWSIALDGLTVL